MDRIEKPLITVVGATSKQGRSVVNSLMQSRRFRAQRHQINEPLCSHRPTSVKIQTLGDTCTNTRNQLDETDRFLFNIRI